MVKFSNLKDRDRVLGSAKKLKASTIQQLSWFSSIKEKRGEMKGARERWDIAFFKVWQTHCSQTVLMKERECCGKICFDVLCLLLLYFQKQVWRLLIWIFVVWGMKRMKWLIYCFYIQLAFSQYLKPLWMKHETWIGVYTMI